MLKLVIAIQLGHKALVGGEVEKRSRVIFPFFATNVTGKIIVLTGPLDQPLIFTVQNEEVVKAYVHYARAKLIYDRALEGAKTDETKHEFAARTNATIERAFRDCRSKKEARKQADNLNKCHHTLTEGYCLKRNHCSLRFNQQKFLCFCSNSLQIVSFDASNSNHVAI